ncbi:glycosyltransferase [Pseudarthrobacter sp. AL07]|uniref:glycosyltransferase n=1 Tax=unclassified Pseudarthrobacter TaxID=2647000 RepID=UPI00249C9770|nr:MULTISPECIES: glycosyltransferase [unclassified Pseudarthrobacter]MDI3195997.1 glycosyltransferase [Pseudarthrobacter sp. AL20]MDI3210062.1 glycosyltransferase [Pseudarthrobacter sp. AL07]
MFLYKFGRRLGGGAYRAGDRSKTDIFFVQTTDISVGSQLHGQLGYLRSRGLRVAVASADTGVLETIAARDQVAAYGLPIKRDPSVVADLHALAVVFALMRRLAPRVVVYGTPKASLLGAIASWALRVPRRVYCVYGLRAETMSGYRRRLMLLIEKTIIFLSTDVVAVGHGLREEMLAAGISGDVMVFGKGSANSVDMAAYKRRGQDEALRFSFREQQGIPRNAMVVGYVGRITADKGIDTLIEAMRLLREELGDVYLLLVGPDEALNGLQQLTIAVLDEYWVCRTGNVVDTSSVYAAMDVFCLPSRREGLPTVLLEAAASGTPIVATNATGVRDVIPDASCGHIVSIDDGKGLAAALRSVLENPVAAASMANHTQGLVSKEFNRERLWAIQYSFYAAATGVGNGAVSDD